MNSETLARYQEWLESPYFDEKTKEELRSLEGNEKEIEDRFYKDWNSEPAECVVLWVQEQIV